LFAHFFVWWKSNRRYDSANRVKAFGGFLSYTMVDKIVLVISSFFILLVLVTLILGDEVTNVFGELVSEILNVIFLFLHWNFVTFIVFFWFMDVGFKVSVATPPSDQARKFNWKSDKRGPHTVRKQHDVFKLPVTAPEPESPFDE
jgi:hypothetical protein